MPLADTLTDIANLALASIGEQQIENIDESTSVAKTIRRMISETIRQTILLVDWPELRVTFKPTGVEDSETGMWTYNLPTNFLEVLHLNPLYTFSALDSWELEAGKLRVPVAGITLTYKRYSEEVTDWSGNLVELIYRKIAANIAMPLTQNQNIAGMAMQEYERCKMAILPRMKNRNHGLRQRKRGYGNLSSRRARGGIY